jgi:CRISPR-associated protein Csm4
LRLYAITIKPLSSFGTPLKGDTIFGHFCWQVAYDPSLVDGGLKSKILKYPEKPFAVFSTAFPKLGVVDDLIYALKRPDIPLNYLFKQQVDREGAIKNRKMLKKKKWVLVDKTLRIDIEEKKLIDDQALLQGLNDISSEKGWSQKRTKPGEYIKAFSQAHNTINRMTSTTGTGIFAPYIKENMFYYPGAELVVFVLIDEDATDIERVELGLKKIGKWGFGRDSSTGLGRFTIVESHELNLPKCEEPNACYLLAPCVPEKDTYKFAYFMPFVRFGKHGDRLATFGNPFKAPVIMADEGAVFFPKDKNTFNKPYIGRAVTGLSKVMPDTVLQGFAPYLPLKWELKDEKYL